MPGKGDGMLLSGPSLLDPRHALLSPAGVADRKSSPLFTLERPVTWPTAPSWVGFEILPLEEEKLLVVFSHDTRTELTLLGVES
jgi:hypothetical protein